MGLFSPARHYITFASRYNHKALRNAAGLRAAFSAAFSADSGPAAPDSDAPSLPPDLADLARRLAALPEAVRAGVVAMVKTCGASGLGEKR
jgi:hypothetical protein